MKKTITILLVLIVIAGVAYLVMNNTLQRESTDENSFPKVFSSQAECEKETGKTCTFQMCDYVPEGKTFEEVCGKNFKKGWIGMTTTQVRAVNGEEINEQSENQAEFVGYHVKDIHRVVLCIISDRTSGALI